MTLLACAHRCTRSSPPPLTCSLTFFAIYPLNRQLYHLKSQGARLKGRVEAVLHRQTESTHQFAERKSERRAILDWAQGLIQFLNPPREANALFPLCTWLFKWSGPLSIAERTEQMNCLNQTICWLYVKAAYILFVIYKEKIVYIVKSIVSRRSMFKMG